MGWPLAVSGSSAGVLSKRPAATSAKATMSYGPASPTSPSITTAGLSHPLWYLSPTRAARAAS